MAGWAQVVPAHVEVMMRGSRSICLLLTLALAGLMPFGIEAAPGRAAVVATTSPATGCDDGGEGLIVYEQIEWSSGDDGTAVAMTGARLVVTRPDGAVLHQIELSAWGGQLFPLGVGCFAIIGGFGGFSSDSAPPLLIDPGAGAARPIALPSGMSSALPFPEARRTSQADRYALLAGDGRLDNLLLLDTQTATTTDVGTAIRALSGGEDEAGALFGVQLSADERYLLVHSEDLWLLPTADPGAGRRIEDGWAGMFSEDGQRILYQQHQGDDALLVVEGVDGSRNVIVATGDRFLHGVWIPGSTGTRVLILRGDAVALLDLPLGQERGLASFERNEAPMLWGFAPSGQRALLHAGPDNDRWVWLDLASGTVRELDPLTNYPSPSRDLAGMSRWLTFMPNNAPMLNAGDAVLGLDLEAGTVRRLLDVDHDVQGAILQPSATGRFAVINSTDPHLDPAARSFWLLDGEEGGARFVAGRWGAAFSADEAWILAIEPVEVEGHPLNSRLVLTSTGDEKDRPVTGDGGSPAVWLSASPPAQATPRAE